MVLYQGSRAIYWQNMAGKGGFWTFEAEPPWGNRDISDGGNGGRNHRNACGGKVHPGETKNFCGNKCQWMATIMVFTDYCLWQSLVLGVMFPELLNLCLVERAQSPASNMGRGIEQLWVEHSQDCFHCFSSFWSGKLFLSHRPTRTSSPRPTHAAHHHGGKTVAAKHLLQYLCQNRSPVRCSGRSLRGVRRWSDQEHHSDVGIRHQIFC